MRPQLDVGATLREVFGTYRSQAAVLLPVAFWLFLVSSIVWAFKDGGAGLALAQVVVAIATAALYQGVVVGLLRDLEDGRRDSSVRDLFAYALPVLGPMLAAGILAGIGIGIGLFLLVAPGLYLATTWAVVVPAIVVERRRPVDAFRRSRQLVEGHAWQVFMTIATAYLLAIGASLALAAAASALANGPLVLIVFDAIASTLTAPITALAAAVLYFRLLGLKGGEASSENPLRARAF